MRVLITGAGGQLGQALQRTLPRGDFVALEEARLDITRLDSVIAAVAEHSPEVVINCAAYNDVDGAESHEPQAFAVNAIAPRNLAIATERHGAALVHLSTDYVFDGLANRPYHEFDAPMPLSVYGQSKLAGEGAVAAHNPHHYIVRTAWLYDAGHRNFPTSMLARAQEPEVRAASDVYGSPTYAPHLAAAIARLIRTGAYGRYHIAGRGVASRFELTRELYKLLHVSTPLRPAAAATFRSAAARPRYSALATIQQPEILLPPWEEGLAEFAVTVACLA